MTQHTIASIAGDAAVSKRTVQNWVKAAIDEHGSIGSFVGNTRVFNESEKTTLLSYGAAKSATVQPVEIYETVKICGETGDKAGNEPLAIEIFRSKSEPVELSIVPKSIDLDKLTGGQVASIDLSTPQAILSAVPSIRAAMGQQVQEGWNNFRETYQAAQTLDNELRQLERESISAQVQTAVARNLQELTQSKMVSDLGKFAASTAKDSA